MKKHLIPSSLVLITILLFSQNAFGALRCSLCGKEITGKYVTYPNLGINVCEQCQETKPHCEKCDVPVNKLIMVGGHGFCERCAPTIEVCHSCGEAIMGEFTFFEGNESLKYCMKCTNKYPRCADCGAPSGPDGTQLDDGRYLCPDCRRIAIFDAGFITPIKDRVRSFMEGNMGMPVKHEITFSLENQVFMKEKSKGAQGDLNGLFYRKGDELNVYVVYGLRERDLLSVLAHEISHAWEAENCDDKLPLEEQEGFAQWVAYKTLIHFSHDDFARLMTTGDNIYSRGLNKMLKIEADGGAKAVFEFIKRKEI